MTSSAHDRDEEEFVPKCHLALNFEVFNLLLMFKYY